MRNLAMLRAAATRGPVDLLSYGSLTGEEGPAVDPQLGQICQRVRLFQTPRRTIHRRALDSLRSPLPDMAHRLWSPAFAAVLDQWLSATRYDVIQIEGIEMARYAMEAVLRPKLVFDDHNVEFLLQMRAQQVDLHRPGRAHAAVYSFIQARKLRGFERSICRASDAVIAVSPEDAAQLQALSGSDVDIIPNAIDMTCYPFTESRTPAVPAVLFPGTMDFRPNADAALWLVERVLPTLLAMRPEVQCYIAGRNPHAALIRHGQHHPAVAVTGEVASMAPYWERASVCVLPLQVGGGSRFKALEAMALGLPIVSTALGMEGIEAIPNQDYLLADDPEAFARSVARLLENRELRRSLARRGRSLVERLYTLDVVTERLNALYDRLGV